VGERSGAVAVLGVELSSSPLDLIAAAAAERLGTVEIVTLDERDFRAVRPLDGGDAFRVLPEDQ
jgi:predicted nucleic acid-binding protein